MVDYRREMEYTFPLQYVTGLDGIHIAKAFDARFGLDKPVDVEFAPFDKQAYADEMEKMQDAAKEAADAAKRMQEALDKAKREEQKRKPSYIERTFQDPITAADMDTMIWEAKRFGANTSKCVMHSDYDAAYMRDRVRMDLRYDD